MDISKQQWLCMGAVLFVSACADQKPVLNTSLQTNTQSLNLLQLAGNDSQPLETPWIARDQDILDAAKNRTPDKLGGPMARLVTETQIPCIGGGLQTRVVDNQAPPWFSTGDIYTTTYQDCLQGATLLNGSRVFSVDSMTGQPYVTPTWDTTTTMARQGFSRTNTVTGAVSLADGTRTTALVATQLPENINWFAYEQITSGSFSRQWENNGSTQTSTGSTSVTFRWDDSPGSGFEWEFDVSTSSSQFGDSAAVTIVPLTGTGSQPPESGQLALTQTSVDGIIKASLVTAVGGGNVLVETDVDNDGVVDTTQTISWNQLIIEPLIYQMF